MRLAFSSQKCTTYFFFVRNKEGAVVHILFEFRFDILQRRTREIAPSDAPNPTNSHRAPDPRARPTHSTHPTAQPETLTPDAVPLSKPSQTNRRRHGLRDAVTPPPDVHDRNPTVQSRFRPPINRRRTPSAATLLPHHQTLITATTGALSSSPGFDLLSQPLLRSRVSSQLQLTFGLDFRFFYRYFGARATRRPLFPLPHLTANSRAPSLFVINFNTCS